MLLFESVPTPVPIPIFNYVCDDMKRVARPTETHMLVELGGGTCGMCYDLARKMSERLMCHGLGSFSLPSSLALCDMCVYMGVYVTQAVISLSCFSRLLLLLLLFEVGSLTEPRMNNFNCIA